MDESDPVKELAKRYRVEYDIAWLIFQAGRTDAMLGAAKVCKRRAVINNDLNRKMEAMACGTDLLWELTQGPEFVLHDVGVRGISEGGLPFGTPQIPSVAHLLHI